MQQSKNSTANSTSERMATEPILPLLLRLSVPGIIAMALQAFYNVVDTIYVGRLSTEALSALSLAFPVQMVLIGIGTGTGIGTSAVIARFLGKGEHRKATSTAEHAIIISLIYGIVLAITGFFFSHNILALFTDDPQLIEMGAQYIKIILIGSTALFFPMAAQNILRGQGNTFIPMIGMLIGSILNIIFDPLFIYGIGFFPRWEIAGAAFATVLARIFSGIFLLFLILSKKNETRPNFKIFQTDWAILKEVYIIGFPAMVMQFIASFMTAGMNKILANFSAVAIAVGGVYFRLQSFVFMPVFGLNHGYTPILAYNYGSKKSLRMKKTMTNAFVIALIFTVTGFLLFQLFPRQLMQLFSHDEELINLGIDALRIISIAFPIIGPSIVAATTFQALGRGLPSLILSILRQLIILLPLLYILGQQHGLPTLWYSFPISEMITATIAAVWLAKYLKEIFAGLKIDQENPGI